MKQEKKYDNRSASERQHPESLGGRTHSITTQIKDTVPKFETLINFPNQKSFIAPIRIMKLKITTDLFSIDYDSDPENNKPGAPQYYNPTTCATEPIEKIIIDAAAKMFNEINRKTEPHTTFLTESESFPTF